MDAKGEQMEDDFAIGILDDVEMQDDELKEELEQLNEEENVTEDSKKTLEKKLEETTSNKLLGKQRETDMSNNRKTEKLKENEDSRKEDKSTLISSKSAAFNKYRTKDSDECSHNVEPHKYDSYDISQVNWKRLFKPLNISNDMDKVIVAREIAYRLEETKIQLFRNILRVLGIHYSIEVFNETKKIIKSGGLKTDNGERKRTPGGTFLYLMKNRGYVTKEQLKEIYKDEAERAKKFKREKRKKANKKSMENFEKRMVELQQMKNVNSEK